MFVTLIGIVGAALILVAFMALEFSWWQRDSLWFDGTNALGASCLLYYAWQLESWPFVVLNALWLIVAGKDIVKRRI